MKEVIEFLTSALPWVAIGLFVSTSCVKIKAKSEGKELGRFFMGICWAPAGSFLFVAIMEIYSGNKSSGMTWLLLGVFNAVINFANTQKEEFYE